MGVSVKRDDDNEGSEMKMGVKVDMQILNMSLQLVITANYRGGGGG